MNDIANFTLRRRRLGLAAMAVAASTLLASCSTLIGPRQVELPLDRMQQGLDKRFPLRQRVLAVLQVELSHPRLRVLDANDRVALELDASVAPLLGRQSWRGSMAISGRLQVDRAHNAIYLSDAHVDRFAFDGMDEGRQNQLASVANLLSDQVIKDMPIHRFRPEDLRYAGVQFELTGIATKPGALVATLAPAP